MKNRKSLLLAFLEAGLSAFGSCRAIGPIRMDLAQFVDEQVEFFLNGPKTPLLVVVVERDAGRWQGDSSCHRIGHH